MSFAGLEDLKPMGINPRPPGPRPEPTPYLHRPSGKAFELVFENKKPPMKYIGTFGTGHEWAGHYIEIHAYDEQTARLMMQEKFGSRWSSLYKGDSMHTAEENAGVKKWNYKNLTNDMIRAAAQEAAKPFNVIEGVL